MESATPVRTNSDRQKKVVLQKLNKLGEIGLYQVENTALLVPLIYQTQLIGLIILGPRWSEEVYTNEDLRLLKTMAHQITLAILTAQQVAELRQYPDYIAETQEAERSRISQDLHDSTQQFLAGLPFTLSTCQAMLTENPAEAAKLLQFCSDHALYASADLRAIRRNLSPEALSNRGLVRALELLVKAINKKSIIYVTLNTQKGIDSLLSPKTQLSLYRIIQQAVENSLKHAQAAYTVITLAYCDNLIDFSITDDGIGFDTTQSKEQVLSGHDGLQIMQHRINLLKGQLKIDSVIGRGTTIQGCIPTDF